MDSEDLAAVAHALNTRPRKVLGWRTPAEAMDITYNRSTMKCCDDQLNPP